MNPYTNTYKSQQVQTASPEELLILLYEGAIRFLNVAKQSAEQNDLEKFHNNVVKAQRIIQEFMTSLDVKLGGEMAQNLYQLYEYLHHQLLQANIKKDATMLDEVLIHLRDLKATWENAISIAKQERASEQYDMPEEGRVYSA